MRGDNEKRFDPAARMAEKANSRAEDLAAMRRSSFEGRHDVQRDNGLFSSLRIESVSVVKRRVTVRA